MKKVLIIGGSSGLGLELAKKYKEQGCVVYITGRKAPLEKTENIVFVELELGDILNLSNNINNFILNLDFTVDVFIYAAGIFHRGFFDEISVDDLLINVSVNYIAPQFLLKELMKKQNKIDQLIGISSIAQFRTPENEPYYSSNKTGFGKYIEIISQDKRIKKTLLISPGGMNTNFWRNHPKTQEKLKEYLDPIWVAEQIILLTENNIKYQSYIIERNPARLVEEKKRN
jgi:short-subunit dehydrogenase